MDAQDFTIRQAQEVVDRWISTTGAGYFSPLTNTAVLAEETGEVARIMARRYGDQVAKPGDKVSAASWLGQVKEQWVSHKIMGPFSPWPTRPASTSPKPSSAIWTRNPPATPHGSRNMIK